MLSSQGAVFVLQSDQRRHRFRPAQRPWREVLGARRGWGCDFWEWRTPIVNRDCHVSGWLGQVDPACCSCSRLRKTRRLEKIAQKPARNQRSVPVKSMGYRNAEGHDCSENSTDRLFPQLARFSLPVLCSKRKGRSSSVATVGFTACAEGVKGAARRRSATWISQRCDARARGAGLRNLPRCPIPLSVSS